MTLPTGQPHPNAGGEPVGAGAVRLVHTMGTVITIDARTPLPEADLQHALDGAEQVLHDADRMFSTYRDDSWVSRLARRKTRLADCPPQVTDVFDLCDAAERLTDGWFTAAWRNDGAMDPTGLVKGWAAARASRLLLDFGVADHCVNAAGDIALAGQPAPGRPWRVGIADPRTPRALLGAVDPGAARAGCCPGQQVSGQAVATSGVGERGPHIRDPHRGRSATGLLSATVLGPDPALADALATALIAAGDAAPPLLERLRPAGWAGCLLTDDGRLLDPDRLLNPRPGRRPSAALAHLAPTTALTHPAQRQGPHPNGE